MSLKYRTKGFIFKKSEKAESDQVFSVFTEDFGRIEIIAKAVRKITSKLRSNIDIFYLSEVEFVQGKNSKTLTDAIKIKRFDSIYKDIKKIKVAFRVSDILDSFIKGEEKDEKTFNFLNEFFDNINIKLEKAKNYQLLFQYFFWNFLSVQGYRLQVYSCSVCRGKINPYNIYFSNKEGGIICKNCLGADREAKKINSDIVKILRLILNKDWHTVSILKIKPDSHNLLEEIYEDSVRAFCPVYR